MLIDFFHFLYNKTFFVGIFKVLSLAKLDKVLRRLIYIVANFLLPFFLKTNYLANFFVKNNKEVFCDYIVSFTSFPARIEKSYLVVLSMATQKIKPKKVILWLSSEQFKTRDCIPERLKSLEGDFFEIRMVDSDLRSYKKYYHLLEEQPEEGFIIVDDDIFYPSNTISKLINLIEIHPGSVCANRAAKIMPEKPYKYWPLASYKDGVSNNILPTGCGGVLYPKGALGVEACDKDVFSLLAPKSDDIWLNCCSYLRNFSFVTNDPEYYIGIYSKNNTNLYDGNINGSGNDRAITELRAHFMNNGVDILERS